MLRAVGLAPDPTLYTSLCRKPPDLKANAQRRKAAHSLECLFYPAEERRSIIPFPSPGPISFWKIREMQGRQTREGEQLLGSSEVLESIIGKFKTVAGERGQLAYCP